MKSIGYTSPWQTIRFAFCALLPLAIALQALAQSRTMQSKGAAPLEEIAAQYYGADAPWYLRNIPFLEIDDPEIEQVYYYRWKVYRSHIREIGAQGTTVLEFLPDVPWARAPWTDLNDSSSFHLMEGRWLRSPAVVNSLIDHLYAGGGNTRAFSESIAAASEAAFYVTGDSSALDRNFDSMRHIDDLWNDHFDSVRNLYWVEPLADATEYTISSIDASGAGFEEHPDPDPARNGFTQGFAYRPSINTYQYANAMAIAHIAERAGKLDLATGYKARASRIQQATITQLWNDKLDHFTDRYQRSTPYVQQGEFIRGRELVGYLPWLYEMTPRTGAESAKYNAAWKHILSHAELLGDAGLRTVEPSYPRYMKVYRFEDTQTECHWNGPSWPFQTSQVLTSLANLLNDYPAQNVIDRSDYLRLLRQYTHQHFLTPRRLDLQEDYDPDHGGPIVGLERSHHYEHSTYVDLILSGLIGIRPRPDNVLEVAPLLPSKAGGSISSAQRAIRSFALRNVAYHGHDIAIYYDETGTRYGLGKGLSIFVDNRRASGPGPAQRTFIPLEPLPASGLTMPEDILVNVGASDGPQPLASSSVGPNAIKEAIDGRLWFFPENANGWTPAASQANQESWYMVTLPHKRAIQSVEAYFLAYGAFHAPQSLRLQYKVDGNWIDVPGQARFPEQVIGNGRNQINFPTIETDNLRILLPASPAGTSLRLIEFEAFQKPRP